jgi:5-methylcytosine-specific restriction endonuclease McrA
MPDCLLYWKLFQQDSATDPSVLNHEWYTDNRNLLTHISHGDNLWVVVSGKPHHPNEWRLLQRIYVDRVRDEKPHRKGRRPYHAIGDPKQSPMYDIQFQPDLTPVLLKLRFVSGKGISVRGKLIGRSLQVIRPLSRADIVLLSDFVKGLRKIDAKTSHGEAEIVASDNMDSLTAPSKTTSTVQRVIRDSIAGKHMKWLYDYECQVCGATIGMPDGRHYAEVHHLRPVGKPHNGKDGAPNSLVVCPNHHAMFDLGLIAIKPGTAVLRHWNAKAPEHNVRLRLKEEHRLDTESVEYQYRKLFKGTKKKRAAA